MIRCIAIDDEPLALDIITDYVSKIPELTLVASTTNAIEVLPLIQQGGVDLVFLDVQMPELTGIQFLKILNGRCDVILTTAYPQYALEGYELNVLDYLLKPIAFDRFYRSVQKALNQRAHRPQEAAVNTAPADALDFIFVKTEHKIQRVDLNDIRYIEGLKDYISIYTAAERIVTLQNMKKMEDILPANRFVRVHRSYIVALDKIGSIERGRMFIDDNIIPVGDTYREAFFRHIGDKQG